MNNDQKSLLQEINDYTHDLALKSIIKKIFSNMVQLSNEVETHTCLIVENSDAIKSINPKKIINQINDCNNKIKNINEKMVEINDNINEQNKNNENQFKLHDKSISDLQYAHSSMINKNNYEYVKFTNDVKHDVNQIKKQCGFIDKVIDVNKSSFSKK
jgi:methyl-accepting chemotaxis protein